MNSRTAKNISYIDFITGKDEDISSPRLLVAKFQRNYKWKKKRITDLINSIENNDSGFYLGNIVIQRTSEGSSGRDFVVDGQQRLVTLSLILKALKKRVEKRHGIDKIIFDCVNKKEPRIKFYRSNLQKAYLNILNDKKMKNLDSSQKTIINNYKIIEKELDKIIKPEEFFKKLKSLEFVVIKCKNTNDVHQLFESLNSKAEILSVVELTKNSILNRMKDDEEDKIRTVESTWESIEKSFERTNIVWFNKFLRHQWFSLDGYISSVNLFDEINKWIKKNGADKYSSLLKEDARVYIFLRRAIGLEKQNFSSEMSDIAWRKLILIIECIKKLNVDQVYAVLLALIKYGQKHKEYFKRDFLVNDIEKIWGFLLLIKYSKISPSAYERIFAKFCYEINNGLNFKIVNDKFFKDLYRNIPSIKDFIENINNNIKCTGIFDKKINYNNDRDFIRVILLVFLSDGNMIIPEQTIEHIIPKGSLIKWKNISPKKIKEIEEKYRYKLGNLTLLAKDTVNNESFDYKYKEAYSVSNFSLNQTLSKDYGPLFNSKNPSVAVIKRGREIAKSIYKIYSNKLKN